jgi:uncharacterized protein with FMN-binding domain
MRRAILTIGGTAAGLAALLAFKSHPTAVASAAGTSGSAMSPTLAAGPTSSADRTGKADGAGSPTSSRASASSSASSSVPSSGASSASSSGATRTLTGTVANTQYGPMQVQVVLTGSRITKVNVLQRTDDGQMSNQVDSFAIPKLTSETLTAQSARIDAVSGASYTSQGYIQSLQSALDQA